jgi:hypothetical protein
MYAQEQSKKEVTSVSYANMVKHGGDQIDCIRLSSCIASALNAFARRSNLSVNTSDICKDVAENVAKFYKVNVRGEYVYHIAFGSQQSGANGQQA